MECHHLTDCGTKINITIGLHCQIDKKRKKTSVRKINRQIKITTMPCTFSLQSNTRLTNGKIFFFFS